MKVPSRLLPTLPVEKMESQTIYYYDFVPQPPFQRPKNFKPEEKHQASDAKIMTVTSYNVFFPQKPLIATYPATSLMETTMPNIRDTTDDFETSHQQVYKPWPGRHRPNAYCEPLQSPMFRGKFSKLTVTMRDYPQKPLCRPRTCYRREEEGILPNFRQEGGPTTGKAFKLPEIKNPPNLQKSSMKSTESMAFTSCKELNALHQQRDKSLSVTSHPKDDGVCHLKLPCPNSLAISGHDEENLLQCPDACYRRLQKQPSQEMAFKKRQGYKEMKRPQKNFTCNKLTFIPAGKELRVQLDEATESTQREKDGQSVKQIQTFDEKKSSRTINHSKYFQFSTTSPRVRYGDKTERKFRPSEAKFVGVSENRGAFVHQTGKPAKLTKPLDEKDNDQQAKHRREEPFTAITTYHEFFPVRSLPKQEICLAEQILQA